MNSNSRTCHCPAILQLFVRLPQILLASENCQLSFFDLIVGNQGRQLTLLLGYLMRANLTAVSVALKVLQLLVQSFVSEVGCRRRTLVRIKVLLAQSVPASPNFLASAMAISTCCRQRNSARAIVSSADLDFQHSCLTAASTSFLLQDFNGIVLPPPNDLGADMVP
jgi:hypothetical protein